jgi:DNA repair protein RadC
MVYNLRIADLPESERPREKLLAIGVNNLSNAELIALLLGTGQGKGKLSAVGLGQYILNQLSQNQRDPLEVLREISPQELMNIEGVGLAKATAILAGLELGKRAYQFRPNAKAIIDSPASAAAALSHNLMWQSQEHFAVLLLDTKYSLISNHVITIGIANQTLVHSREVFKEAIRQSATNIIIAHNHPSGNLDPSPEDLALTEQLLQVSEIVGIPIIDHLILGNGEYKSIRQNSSLWD